MKKRYVALILLLIMVVAVFASCNVGGSETSNVSENSVDDSFFGLDLPEDLYYGGSKTVKVLTTSTNDDWSYQIQPSSNPNYSAESVSAIVSAAAERTRIVEEKLGIVIEEQVIYTSNRYGGEMYQRIITDMSMGGSDYLICMPASTEAAMLSTEGVLLDLASLDKFVALLTDVVVNYK